MRILHVITTIDVGGAEKHLLELSSLQAEEGHLVYVYPLKGELALLGAFQEAGINVISKGTNKSILFQYVHISYLSQTLQLDIIHAHLPRSEILISLLLNFHHIRLIASRHNAETILGKRKANIISIILAWFVEKRFYRIICISRSVLDYLVSQHEVRLKDKWRIIYYGLPKHKTNWKVFKEFDGVKIKLVTVSRLVPQKNLFLIIDTARMLLDNRVDFLWEVYGEGPQRTFLQFEIDKRGLTDKVLLRGKNPNIASILQEFDFFVLASEYEGFGLSILEALDSGIPVIISKTPTSLELFGSNYPGLFDPKSASSLLAVLRNFLSDVDLVNDVVKDLDKISSKFNSSTMYRYTESVYKFGEVE